MSNSTRPVPVVAELRAHTPSRTRAIASHRPAVETPPLERGGHGILQGILCQVDVTDGADQHRQDPARLLPQGSLENLTWTSIRRILAVHVAASLARSS